MIPIMSNSLTHELSTNTFLLYMHILSFLLFISRFIMLFREHNVYHIDLWCFNTWWTNKLTFINDLFMSHSVRFIILQSQLMSPHTNRIHKCNNGKMTIRCTGSNYVALPRSYEIQAIWKAPSMGQKRDWFGSDTYNTLWIRTLFFKERFVILTNVIYMIHSSWICRSKKWYRYITGLVYLE